MNLCHKNRAGFKLEYRICYAGIYKSFSKTFSKLYCFSIFNIWIPWRPRSPCHILTTYNSMLYSCMNSNKYASRNKQRSRELFSKFEKPDPERGLQARKFLRARGGMKCDGEKVWKKFVSFLFKVLLLQYWTTATCVYGFTVCMWIEQTSVKDPFVH